MLTSFHIKIVHYNVLIKSNYKKYEEYLNITNQKEHVLNKIKNKLCIFKNINKTYNIY